MAIENATGQVAIWLGTNGEDLPLDQRSRHASGTQKSQPVSPAVLLADLGYSASFQESAVAAAETLCSGQTFKEIFALYDHRDTDAAGPVGGTQAVYLGAFPFDRRAAALEFVDRVEYWFKLAEERATQNGEPAPAWLPPLRSHQLQW